MVVFENENLIKNRIELGIFTLFVILFIAIGFGVIGSQGIFRETGKIIPYILLTGYNFVFIAFVGADLFFKEISKYFIAFFHNFENSLIQNSGIWPKIKKNTIPYIVLDNFVLTFLIFIILFSPIFFLGFLVPRQTAIFFLPVEPQSVFPVKELGFRIFYQVFPAFSGETGLLTIINSVTASIIILVFGATFGRKSKPIGHWLSLALVGFLLSGFAWQFVHGTVAAGREFNQIAHFIFGVEQGVLMVIFGSIAPALALHFLNLLFYALNEVIGGIEFFKFGFPLLMFVISSSIVIGGLIFTFRKGRKK